jgi:phenylalanine-4-hydroxylase
LKAYGAGLVSSPGELIHATTADTLRLPFDPARIMRTDYAIDAYQKVYFVIESFDQLISGLVDLDFGPIYEEGRNAPSIPPGALLDGETEWTPRSSTT